MNIADQLLGMMQVVFELLLKSKTITHKQLIEELESHGFSTQMLPTNLHGSVCRCDDCNCLRNVQ